MVQLSRDLNYFSLPKEKALTILARLIWQPCLKKQNFTLPTEWYF